MGRAPPAQRVRGLQHPQRLARKSTPPSKIVQIVGTEGEQTGDVYKITVGRDDLKLTEMGAPINARMGLNTWAAFVGANDNATIAGDVAMLANEVTPVLKALRNNGLDVVAIHHHMTQTQPTVFFLHYWGTGPAEKLATGFKAALAEPGKATPTASRRSRGDFWASRPAGRTVRLSVLHRPCARCRVGTLHRWA